MAIAAQQSARQRPVGRPAQAIKRAPQGKPAPAVKRAAVPGKAVQKRELTPLEKARLAKRQKAHIEPGTTKPKAVAKKAAAEKPVFQFDPPDEFKPQFFKVKLYTAKDGLPRKIECTRIDGRWDNDLPRKNNDLSDFDIPTQNALIARLCGKLFAVAPAKRLRPNAAYFIWIRAATRAAREKEIEAGHADEGQRFLGARIYKVQRWTKKKGKPVGEFLLPDTHKTDADRRKINSSGRFLAGAFTQSVLPPKRVRGKIVGEED